MSSLFRELVPVPIVLWASSNDYSRRARANALAMARPTRRRPRLLPHAFSTSSGIRAIVDDAPGIEARTAQPACAILSRPRLKDSTAPEYHPAGKSTWKNGSYGIDRGGTFTDVVALRPDGRIVAHKLLSENPGRYRDAAIAGIRELLGVSPGATIPGESIER